MSRKKTASAKPPELTPEEAKKELDRRYVARELLRPSTLAGNSIDALKMTSLTDIQALTLALREQAELVTGKNDLSRAEAMLICQAHTLDAIFGKELMTAMRQEGLPQFEAHAKLAMRAQRQCVQTLEALALLKNPPNPTFIRQANVAHNQQVNNGTPPPSNPARAQETENPQNRLLERQHGERLDTRAAGTASGADPAMATLAGGDRAANRCR